MVFERPSLQGKPIKGIFVSDSPVKILHTCIYKTGVQQESMVVFTGVKTLAYVWL